MNELEGISEIFIEIAKMAERLGVSSLKDHDGCWEIDVDDNWFIAMNGHKEPIECSRNEEKISPFHCYIEWNGWPAGIINPGGGSMVAGELANEDTLIVALKLHGV